MLVIEIIQDGPQLRVHGDEAGLLEFIQMLEQCLHSNEVDKLNFPVTYSNKILSDQAVLIKGVVIYKRLDKNDGFSKDLNLSFEWNLTGDSVEIYGNTASLENLKERCKQLNGRPLMDHIHLMSPEWGGDELIIRVHEDGHLPIYHVKIMKWM